MMGKPEDDIIMRALKIAPACGSIQEVKRRLIQEGYVNVNTNLSDWQVRRKIVARLNRSLKHHVPKRLVTTSPQ